MCCGRVGYKTGDDLKLEGQIDCGLVAMHVYSLINVIELVAPESSKNKNLITHRICVIRNPWGTHEWKGAWNDKDPRWTPELRSKIGFKAGNDGLFCMDFRDFINYFGSITMCLVNDNYFYSSYKV